ncbi:hypothetical protein [Amycolatopsis minnesotensis]
MTDDEWGEQVTVVVQLHKGQIASAEEPRAIVKERFGSVKRRRRW